MTDDAYGYVPDFEPVYAALYALTEGIRWGSDDSAMFTTRNRRLRLFNEVDATAQPALYQTEHNETETPTKSQGGKVTLDASWIIYFRASDASPGAPTINGIMKGVRRALRPLPPDPGFHDRRLTLGGLAHSVRIEGQVFKDPGDLDDQGLLTIPIKILMP